jgi:hypothetical protein
MTSIKLIYINVCYFNRFIRKRKRGASGGPPKETAGFTVSPTGEIVGILALRYPKGMRFHITSTKLRLEGTGYTDFFCDNTLDQARKNSRSFY